jgi:hypothetical protein
MENNLEVLQNIKGNEMCMLKKRLHFFVYFSTIHNSQEVETNSLPANKWIKKMLFICIVEYFQA